MQIWNSFFFIKLVETKYPHQIHMKHIKLPYILIATLTFPTTIITNLATNLITNSHQYHHPYCYLIYTQQHKKVVNSKTEAFSLTVNISINSWSNLTTKDSFKILRKSWFWNCQCPWLLDLIKNWQRYWHWQSKRKLPFSNWPLFLSLGVYAEIWHYCIA